MLFRSPLAAVEVSPPGPVLEPACGTGRVAVPLAASSGRVVVGLDLDPAMAAVAVARGLPVVVGDMRTLPFPRQRFAHVMIAWNSLQLLDSDDDRIRCLSSAATCVMAGGGLSIEVTDFQVGVVHAEVGWSEIARSPSIVLAGALSHDLAARASTYQRRVCSGGAVEETEVVLRSLDATEATALVTAAGWSVTTTERDGPRTRLTAMLG